MKVSSVMKKHVRTVRLGDSVRKAVGIMNANRIGSVVVVEKNRLVGIFTERDILRNVVAKNKKADSTRVKSVMTRRVFTIDAEAGIEDAINIMAKRHIKKLPVLRDGELVGIITATDVLRSGERLEYAALKKLAQFYPVYVGSRSAG